MKEDLKRLIKSNYVHLDVYINQNCNLNCKSCIRCAPLYEYEEYPLNVFERDLKRLKDIGIKFGVSLNGGEPLLNKHLFDYLKISVKYADHTQINTNTILIPHLSQEILNFISDNNVQFILTFYPICNNKEKIIKYLEKNNIVYTVFNNLLTNLYSFSDKLVFQYNRLCERRCNPKYAFDNCMEAVGAIWDGKFYICGKPIISKKLNEKYGTNFEITEDDYLDIYKINSISDFTEFYKKAKHFCGYCRDKIRPVKENTFEWSNKHSADLKIEFIES